MGNSTKHLACHLLQTATSVAATGSPVASARQLGIAVTTVYRHLATLEVSLGVPVFDRHHSGWTLRQEAQSLLAASREIERLLQGVKEEVRAAASLAPKTLRIAASEDLASYYVAPLLREFIQECDGVQPDLIVSNCFADLIQGEADVAIRPHCDPGDDLVGRRMCAMSYAFYASRKYIRRKGQPTAKVFESGSQAVPIGHALCGYGSALSHFAAARWLDENIGDHNVIARFGSTSSMIRAVLDGLGIGLLPRFVGDALPSLIVVATLPAGLPVDLWLVTADANRKRFAVKAFFKFFAKRISADRALFSGKPLSR